MGQIKLVDDNSRFYLILENPTMDDKKKLIEFVSMWAGIKEEEKPMKNDGKEEHKEVKQEETNEIKSEKNDDFGMNQPVPVKIPNKPAMKTTVEDGTVVPKVEAVEGLYEVKVQKEELPKEKEKKQLPKYIKMRKVFLEWYKEYDNLSEEEKEEMKPKLNGFLIRFKNNFKNNASSCKSALIDFKDYVEVKNIEEFIDQSNDDQIIEMFEKTCNKLFIK